MYFKFKVKKIRVWNTIGVNVLSVHSDDPLQVTPECAVQDGLPTSMKQRSDVTLDANSR